jgi:DNA-binding transcriptional regulator LsrR (DeoR family)
VKERQNCDRLRLATKVAYCHHELGMSQIDICDLLSLSQSRVSRLLAIANSEGVIKTVIQTPPGVFIDLEHRIENAFGLIEVVIIDDTHDAESIISLANGAADYLEATLAADDIVGISSWSATLLQTFEAMKARPNKVVKKAVQIIGGASRNEAQSSAEKLVSRFSSIVSAEPVYLNAPAVFDTAEELQFALKEESVLKVQSIWETLTCALLGIGPIPQSRLLRESGHSLSDELQEQFLKDNLVGEVCLRFFDTWGNHIPTTFESRVLSIQLAEFFKIPRRIGIANGVHKVSAIKGAMQGGWINVLITDLTTARAIL